MCFHAAVRWSLMTRAAYSLMETCLYAAMKATASFMTGVRRKVSVHVRA